MKRRWNLSIWVGFLLVLVGLLSYVPIFALFPATRDFPWVNLLLFAVGGALLASGLARAFRQPQIYRGKIFGSILAVISLLGIGMFGLGIFYLARQLPASKGAPRVGEKAPNFTLPDQNGKLLSLAELLAPSPADKAKPKISAVLLIFYRGHW